MNESACFELVNFTQDQVDITFEWKNSHHTRLDLVRTIYQSLFTANYTRELGKNWALSKACNVAYIYIALDWINDHLTQSSVD